MSDRKTGARESGSTAIDGAREGHTPSIDASRRSVKGESTRIDASTRSGAETDPDDATEAAAVRELERESAGLVEDFLGFARQYRLLCVTELQSDLGRDEHRLAVLRRIRHGEPGAVQLDGHFVLTEAAHTEELAIRERNRKAGRA